MLLTITTTHRPATDFGFLLMKHPADVHTATLPFGTATLFYPEASEKRCTAAITLDVDTIEPVRLLNTAMGGRSKDRQELADTAIPLEAVVTPLPARGGAGLVERLFGPLGYTVSATSTALDPVHPDWGDSSYVALRLTGEVRLAALLTHPFVLIPVLDNQKRITPTMARLTATNC